MPYTHFPQPGHEVVTRAQGDYLQFYYHLWLFADTVRGQTPWFQDPYEFAVPQATSPPRTYFVPLSLIYLVFFPLGGIAAYNLLVLSTFVLSGLAGYLFALRLVHTPGPAVLAGVVFALAPYRLGSLLGGHPTGFAFFFLPLILLALDHAVRERSWGGSVAAGLLTLTLPAVEPHFLYLLCLILPFYLLVRGMPGRVQAAPTGEAVRALAGRVLVLLPFALGLVGAVTMMLYVKKRVLDLSIVRAGRTLQEIRLFSPTFEDLWTRWNVSATEQIYPGLLAVLLAGVGVGWGLLNRKRDPQARRVVLFFLVLFLLAELLSLGPRTAVPLYDLAYRIVPFFAFLRQTSKFQVLALLALAVLVAFGTKGLQDRLPRRLPPWVIAGVLLSGLLLDYRPPRPAGVSLLPGQNQIYAELRGLTSPARVLFIPVWPGESSWSSLYQYTATLTRVPMVNGYSPAVSRRYVEEVYRPLDHVNRGEITEFEYGLLKKLGVTHLVLDRGAFPTKVSPFPSGLTLSRLETSPYLEPVAADNPLWLFTLRNHPGPVPAATLPTSPQGIFFEAEWMHRRVGRVISDGAASGGAAAGVALGEAPANHLVFGAHAGLPRGHYRVIFRIKGGGPAEEVLAGIEVAADEGRTSLARLDLRGRDLAEAYGDRTLDLTVADPRTVEFRVYWTGRGHMAVDYIYATFADQHDPQDVYPLEALSHALLLRRGPTGAGWVAFADPARTPRDHLLAGPYRRYPAGRYRVRFRIAVEERFAPPQVWLAVAEAHRRTILSERRVRPSEFQSSRAPEDLDLFFEVTQPTVIELLAKYEGGGAFILDQILVDPLREPQRRPGVAGQSRRGAATR
ncbi:MAG: hypothetical protein HYS14_06105 [Candidatus Rokubacteria bacterium]|nr:hypothetical protein [Candidatus Rokubacteria bacterium]